MKYLVALILSFLACSAFACEQAKGSEPPTFARVIEDSTGKDILIFFPYEVEGAQADSAYVNYFQNNKFLLTVRASIKEIFPKEHKLDPKIYRFSYLALEGASINDIKFNVRYSYPPSEDGSVTLCGPIRSFELGEIVEKA